MLVVNADGKRMELKPGEQVGSLGSGELRFEELRGWMGYRIFFDPTLPWLMVAAIACCGGFALQFWASRCLRHGSRRRAGFVSGRRGHHVRGAS